MGQVREACKSFVGNTVGNSPLDRPNSRWEDTTRTDVAGIGSKTQIGFMWLRTENDRLINLHIPQKSWSLSAR
jgi:hypothetical protein